MSEPYRLIPSLLWIFLLVTSIGCSEQTNPTFKPLRLTDSELIKSYSSQLADQVRSCPVPSAENPTVKLDSESKWYPFHVGFELGRLDPDKFDSNIEPPPKGKNRKNLVIQSRRGVAYIVPVRPNSKILVECKGGFGKNKLEASVSLLSTYLPLEGTYQPGLLKKYMKYFGKGDVRLQLNKEKKRAVGSLVQATPETKALLLKVISNTKINGMLNEVKFTYVDNPSSKIDHNCAEFFTSIVEIDNILKPSLILTPGAKVVYEDIQLPKQAHLSCNMDFFDTAPDGINVVMKGETVDGQSHEIFSWPEQSYKRGWAKMDVDLSNLSETAIRFSITCNSKVKTQGSQPLILFGSPMITSQDASQRQPGYNLVLISLDTLRADHLGCYGYSRKEPMSPNIDLLASSSALFKKAYAPAPFTLPSHASLFTGLYSSAHGVETKYSGGIPSSLNLLAEYLRGDGFITASYNGGCYVSHHFGFHWGYDNFCVVDPLGDKYMDGYLMHKPQVLSDGSTGSLDRTFSWIESMRNQKFYLFLHTFMVHDYQPPRRLAEEFSQNGPASLKPGRETLVKIQKYFGKNGTLTDDQRQYLINMYDGSIRAADEMVGALISHLKQLGIDKNTIIIITSDHGEEFLDHGRLYHRRTLYNELIHVPLIIYIPGETKGIVLDDAVSLVDVTPTILDIMQIDSNGTEFNGRSLKPLIKGKRMRSEVIYSEVNVPEITNRQCIIEKGWKYIKGSVDRSLRFPAPAPVQIFNLDVDPHEKQDRSDSGFNKEDRLKKVLNEMEKRLINIRKKMNIKREHGAPLNKELLEKLKQQGYI